MADPAASALSCRTPVQTPLRASHHRTSKNAVDGAFGKAVTDAYRDNVVEPGVSWRPCFKHRSDAEIVAGRIDDLASLQARRAAPIRHRVAPACRGTIMTIVTIVTIW